MKIEVAKRVLSIAVMLAALSLMVYTVAVSFYNQGRMDFHHELLMTLESNGSAPVLLYGPEYIVPDVPSYRRTYWDWMFLRD